MSEMIESKIDAFLGRAEITRTELRRSTPGLLVVDQVNDSLVFVSPTARYLYVLEYVDNYVNRAAGPQGDQLVWHDDYLMVPVRECRRKDNPSLFLEILKTSLKKSNRQRWKVVVLGKEHTFSTYNRAMKNITAIKQMRDNPMDIGYKTYKDATRIKLIDPYGNSTWFIKEPGPEIIYDRG